MRKRFWRASKIIAGVLCMSLFTVTAFGATTKEKELDIVSLDYETALEMAIKNNSTLKQIADSIEVTLENRDDVFGGVVRPGNAGDLVIVDTQVLATLSTLRSLDTSYRTSKISEEVTKIGLEAGVKNAFAAITLNESKLKLLEKSYVIQKQLLAQGTLKENLGMMSKKDLEDLNRETKQMAEQIQQLKMNIDNGYIALNDLVGLPAETRYTVINTVEYTPLEMNMSIDMYVTRKLSTDQSLKIQQLATENAEFSAKTVAIASTGSEHRNAELNATNTARDYKNAKEAKDKSIREAYIQLQQMESMRKNLETDLEKAKSDYEKAQVNFQVGNITQLTLDQAALALDNVENSLLENTLNYDLLKFSFDNTCLLGNAG